MRCPFTGCEVSPLSSFIFLFLIPRPRVNYGLSLLYARAIADVIMARTLRSCVHAPVYVCVFVYVNSKYHSCTQRAHTRAPVRFPRTGFHLSVPQILLPRETHRENNPPRSRSFFPTRLIMYFASGTLVYGRGGAAFYRFYIARLTTFDKMNERRKMRERELQMKRILTYWTRESKLHSRTVAFHTIN